MGIFLGIVGAALALVSARYAKHSYEDTHEGETMPKYIGLVRALVNLVFIILSWYFFPFRWVYFVVLVFIATMYLFNREGPLRRSSWTSVAFIYAVLLLLATTRSWDTNGTAPSLVSMLPFLIAVVYTIICRSVSQIRYDKEGAKADLKFNLILIAATAVAIIVVVAVISAKFS